MAVASPVSCDLWPVLSDSESRSEEGLEARWLVSILGNGCVERKLAFGVNGKAPLSVFETLGYESA